MAGTARATRLVIAAGCALLLAGASIRAQSNAPPEDFSAVAIVNNNLTSGAGRVLMHISRWTGDAERDRLAQTLVTKGPEQFMKELTDAKPVGTIRTPDSLGYDLHYAHQQPAADGGRQIVIATDRPIGFWEAWNRPRSIDYPFTVIQMRINKDGEGTGTMSLATKINVVGKNIIELENFATSPVMLTKVTAEKRTD